MQSADEDYSMADEIAYGDQVRPNVRQIGHIEMCCTVLWYIRT